MVMTNGERLLGTALKAVGVKPVIIGSADLTNGSSPGCAPAAKRGRIMLR